MSRSVMRAEDEVITLISKWDIGSTGAHTKTSGVPGTGFASVARTAAGKYTVTFNRGLPMKFVDMQVLHHPAADAAPLVPRQTVGGFTAETAAAAATCTYETWNIANAPAQTELSSGDKVVIIARFLKTK